MQIKARGRDVLWNYGGLFFRMAGQFFVLPLVLSLLDSEYVGLWYVFTAVSGFIVLFQAGFDPTFARNVAYCWSGARSFSKNGLADEYGEGVDLVCSLLCSAPAGRCTSESRSFALPVFLPWGRFMSLASAAHWTQAPT